MVTYMNEQKIRSLEDVRIFLAGTMEVEFSIQDKDERYRWIEQTLRRFKYRTLGRADRGLVLRYVERVSGYSRQTVTRLVAQYRDRGKLRRRQRTVAGFARYYTDADARLLAELDELHGTPCGAAAKKLCERMYRVHGDERFRRSRTSRSRTCTTCALDTVHQGDLDGIKGVYHINAVDEVTQFQCVLSVERISERFLIPVLEAILETFPFTIQGFHADNGSEYINHRVAELLNKLNEPRLSMQSPAGF